MPKFKKKPIEIEAHQWFKNGDHPEDGVTDPSKEEGKVVRYYRNPYNYNYPPPTSLVIHEGPCTHCGKIMRTHGQIDTLEGVCPGDWIATGAKGERYPIKPDVFAETYDLSSKKNIKKKIDEAAQALADLLVSQTDGLTVEQLVTQHQVEVSWRPPIEMSVVLDYTKYKVRKTQAQ